MANGEWPVISVERHRFSSGQYMETGILHSISNSAT